MVRAEGVDRCEAWDRAGTPCGAKATSWTVSWDVTGEITVVSGACGAHEKKITRAAVRKWGLHAVTGDVARAIAARAGRHDHLRAG